MSQTEAAAPQVDDATKLANYHQLVGRFIAEVRQSLAGGADKRALTRLVNELESRSIDVLRGVWAEPTKEDSPAGNTTAA